MTASTTSCAQDLSLADRILRRIAADLSSIVDRPLQVRDVRTERTNAKPTTSGGIHVSFRLGFQDARGTGHGCVLVPLAEAISLGAYLMMESDQTVEHRRRDPQVDRGDKDALIELGKFLAVATEAALREGLGEEWRCHGEGCQGVAEGAKPVFRYRVGAELLAASATVRLHTWPEFELRLVLPVLASPQARAA